MNSFFKERYCITVYTLAGEYLDNRRRSNKQEAIKCANDWLLDSFNKFGEPGRMYAIVYNDLIPNDKGIKITLESHWNI
jgi:hypothetical protein